MASTPKGTLTLDPGTQGVFGARPPELGAVWVTQTQQCWGAETQRQEAAPVLGSPAPALRSASGKEVAALARAPQRVSPVMERVLGAPRCRCGPESPGPRQPPGTGRGCSLAGGGPAVGALAEQQLINLAALGVLQALGEPGGRHAARMGRKSQRAPGLIVRPDCWRESSL